MRVLLINGSPNAKGNTALALGEMEAVFRAEGIETETIHVGNKACLLYTSPSPRDRG